MSACYNYPSDINVAFFSHLQILKMDRDQLGDCCILFVVITFKEILSWQIEMGHRVYALSQKCIIQNQMLNAYVFVAVFEEIPILGP